MEKRRFGNTDMNVSALGFGGAEIGFEDASLASVEKLLGTALDAGLNVIDTAECYADSEEKIGRAVGHRRDEFYLFTKCGHDGKSFGLDDWSVELLEKSINRSLKNLKTDCVDLIQLHTCGRDLLEAGDVIRVLERARQAGKTRYIGYSGDRDDAEFAAQLGVFDTLQTSISVFDQQNVELALPVAREKNMGVIAKRPLGNAAWRHAELQAGAYWENYWRRMKKLDYPFLQKSPDEIASVALRWTLSTPGVHTAIVGTTKPERWISNAHLLNGGALSQHEYDAIRARWGEVADDSWTAES
jgi:aryl-alcohol dehydrogenase-like predicted oxidoreductase